MTRFFVQTFTTLLGICLATAPLAAQLKSEPGEWPAWRGPDRTAVSKETGLMKQWSADGPKRVWKLTGLGTGFSTPSIAKGKIFVMGTVGQQEHLIALDVQDGKKVWSTPIGALAGGHPGPRCTPTVDGETVYAISSDGKLVSANVSDGKVKWKKDFKADFAGKHGSWAYAESPLIDGEVLVCTPGGESATLVALNKDTGSVIWKAAVAGLKSEAKTKKGAGKNYGTAGYSSVIAADINGIHQYVQFLSGGVVGVDAKTGKMLWHYDRPANGTANISTPIAQGDTVFAASGYGTGGGLAKITPDGAKEVHFVRELQNHHGGVILVGDYLYGTGSQSLYCVEFKTGKIKWSERGVGKGSIAYADGLIFHRGEKGGIALVEANPTAYTEKGRFDQPDRSTEKAWPHPVVAGGRMYIRDWDILLCYDVKTDKSGK